MAEVSLAQLRKQVQAEGGLVGDLITEGPHRSVVVESTTKVNANGKRQFVLKFEIATGPDTGRKIMETITISPESDKALAVAMSNLEILGAGSAIEREASPEEVAKAMLGSTAEIVVYHDSGAGFDGKTRHKVKYINAASGGTVDTTTVPVTAATSGNVPF